MSKTDRKSGVSLQKKWWQNKNHHHRLGIGFCLTIVILAGSAGSAGAASAVNKDNESHTIIVTQGATKNDLLVAPNETVEFCSSSCFVTFPNGDRAALTGNETIEISGGKPTFK